MSTVLLRHILSSGFCGAYTPSRAADAGSIHHALDSAIASGDLDKFVIDTVRIQECGKNKIPYPEHAYFTACLLGISERGERFKNVKAELKTVEFMGRNISFFLLTEDDSTIVEPLYEFYHQQNWCPVYSICAARIMGYDLEPIRVRGVSVLSDFEVSGKFPIIREHVDGFIESYLNGTKRPGSPCLSCNTAGCSFQNPFEQQMLGYMKLRQSLQDAEDKIRQHLIWHGPTQCGAHLVYMRETLRRFFKDKRYQEFLGILMHHNPKDYTRFLSPDGKDVAEAVGKGLLPQSLMNFFSVSRSHKIETSVNL